MSDVDFRDWVARIEEEKAWDLAYWERTGTVTVSQARHLFALIVRLFR